MSICCKLLQRSCLDVALKILATILFFIGIFEIVGLGMYIEALGESNNTACCGIISHEAGTIPGAVCNVDDINGSAIATTTDDEGNVWCTVGGTICDTKSLGNSTVTLSQCFNTSGHNVSSMCSAEALEGQAETAQTVPIVIAAVVLALLLATTSCTILSFCGCCKRYEQMKDRAMSAKCFESKKCYMRCMLINVIFTTCLWYALFLANTIWVDDILDNGYALKTLDTVSAVIYGDWTMEDISDDVDAACDIDGYSWSEGFIWVNYDLDVDSYLVGSFYTGLGAFALVCSTLELFFFIRVNYCLKKSLWDHDKAQERGTSGSTDMA